MSHDFSTAGEISSHRHSFAIGEEEKPIMRSIARQVSAAMVEAAKDGRELTFDQAIAPIDEAERESQKNRDLHTAAALAAYDSDHVDNVPVLARLREGLFGRLRTCRADSSPNLPEKFDH